MALDSRAKLRSRAATEESVASLGSAGKVRAVTKSNVNDLPDGVPVALVVGTAGTLNFIDMTGETCSNYPAAAGINPIRPVRVLAGGTAADIWALYSLDD